MKGYFYHQDPGEDEILGFKCSVAELSSIEEMETGFIITSFNKEKIYNLKPISSISTDYLDQIQLGTNDVHIIGFDQYREQVLNAVEFCKRNEGKVVMSRLKKTVLPQGFSLKCFFIDICKKYSHSFNYCLCLEGGTVWLGATPEVLIRSKDGRSSIYSLAGSRDAENPFEWTEKEKTEQKFVTDTISAELMNLSIDFEIDGPKTVRAANLEHLLSEFHFTTAMGLQVANLIHPTPAVCGIPREKALEFIRKVENHDRKFYSGIIGWKKGKDLSLYVNLRCGEVSKDAFLSYVGGGITGNSNPEKEWEETEIKSQTLLSILKKN